MRARHAGAWALLFVALLPGLAAGQGTEASRASQVRGVETARVEIVEFCDFESKACAELAIVLGAALREFPDQVRLVFRHVPAANGAAPGLSHRAALAAGEQGRFWEMHDVLLANRDRRLPADMLGMARQLELDLAAFDAALARTEWDAAVEDALEARRLGVTAVPTVFVNGTRAASARTLDEFRTLIRAALGGE